MGDNISVIGKGIKFPVRLKNRTDIELVSGNERIKQKIKILVKTSAANPSTGKGGDRVYNRNVGLNLKQYLFKNDTPTNRAKIVQELLRIPTFEPSIIITEDMLSVTTDPLNQNKLLLKIGYEIEATGQRDSLVVPLFKRNRFGEITNG